MKMKNDTLAAENECFFAEHDALLQFDEKEKKELPPDDCDGECFECEFYGQCKDLCDDKELNRLLSVITGKTDNCIFR